MTGCCIAGKIAGSQPVIITPPFKFKYKREGIIQNEDSLEV